MKKIFFYILGLILTLKTTYADDGILGDGSKAKEGDFHINDIPGIIRGIIDFGIGIAGTVAIIFIIVGAYQILFGGITEGSKTKGKSTIIAAITGFVIALLAWFIIKLLIDNLQK